MNTFVCKVVEHLLKMLGCFNPISNLDKFKHWVKNVTQRLGLSIFDPKLG